MNEGEDAIEDERQIEVMVIALVPEFHLVMVQAPDGCQYALTRHTQGVLLTGLRKGQKLRCTVTGRLPRVLIARLIKD